MPSSSSTTWDWVPASTSCWRGSGSFAADAFGTQLDPGDAVFTLRGWSSISAALSSPGMGDAFNRTGLSPTNIVQAFGLAEPSIVGPVSSELLEFEGLGQVVGDQGEPLGAGAVPLALALALTARPLLLRVFPRRMRGPEVGPEAAPTRNGIRPHEARTSSRSAKQPYAEHWLSASR